MEARAVNSILDFETLFFNFQEILNGSGQTLVAKLFLRPKERFFRSKFQNQLYLYCGVDWACGGEAHRAKVAACHQIRSTRGKQKNSGFLSGCLFREFIQVYTTIREFIRNIIPGVYQRWTYTGRSLGQGATHLTGQISRPSACMCLGYSCTQIM